MAKRKRKAKTKRRIKYPAFARSLYKRRTRKRKKKNSKNKYGGVVGANCNINEQPAEGERNNWNRYLSNNCDSKFEYCGKDYKCTRRLPYYAGVQRWGTGPHPGDAPTSGAQ